VPFRPSKQQRTAPDEVDAAINELDDFAEWAAESGSMWTVAVVCLYAAQKRLFDRDHRIRKRWGPDRSRPGVKLSVGTVDSFQGKEADFVVLSVAAPRQTSFLKSPNRINVALTRARSQLVIIGDAEAIMQSDITETTLLGAAARCFPRDFPLT
jgi:superfamily I DNA and/or RNA helicase